MNDTNPIQEENPTPPLATKNSVTGDELSPSTQEETPLEKHPSDQEIDLNELFPDAETDLNNLFPDTEVKHLLKSIVKNKKDWQERAIDLLPKLGKTVRRQDDK